MSGRIPAHPGPTRTKASWRPHADRRHRLPAVGLVLAALLTVPGVAWGWWSASADLDPVAASAGVVSSPALECTTHGTINPDAVLSWDQDDTGLVAYELLLYDTDPETSAATAEHRNVGEAQELTITTEDGLLGSLVGTLLGGVLDILIGYIADNDRGWIAVVAVHESGWVSVPSNTVQVEAVGTLYTRGYRCVED